MQDNGNVIIIGAGPLGIDVIETMDLLNQSASSPIYRCIGFVDDDSNKWLSTIKGRRVLGPLQMVTQFAAFSSFVFCIGNPDSFYKREEICHRLNLPPEKFISIIHPSASVSHSAKLGQGVIILQHVYIGSDVAIGNHVVISPNTTIHHGVSIADYSMLASGVHVAGDAKIGKSAYIGMGSSIRGGVRIGDFACTGLGSAVIRDVPENQVFVGNPAAFLKHTRS
ncbi:NeuD/PglB/VioB family sugar acetyltransferase [Brevibacillus migulae]|uniref:NeuD/PglB/VioB family sugar acetyltransferase n=1 Tax=Brevibacillus migulae TaxID=1644114 RepID=UPI00106E144D|nr:NeuD/PglB/VioB family sugar acetyltransferase [Brevibacillus migulae]